MMKAGAHDLAAQEEACLERTAILMRWGRMSPSEIAETDLRRLSQLVGALIKIIKLENGKSVVEVSSNHETDG